MSIYSVSRETLLVVGDKPTIKIHKSGDLIPPPQR